MKPIRLVFLVAVLSAISNLAFGQDAKEKVAAVKASLTASQALLRQYEWIETTVVSLKGEVKAQKVFRCYYGEDNKIQKVPLLIPPKDEKKGGLRGKIADKKKEEMTDYMSEAVDLVKTYLPPDPARIQAAQATGNMEIKPLPGGKQARITFENYLKKGDSLSLDIDTKNNRLTAAKVATYVDSDKEPVIMTVQFDTLNDTIVYTASTTLDAKGKNLNVTVENSGYRKAGK